MAAASSAELSPDTANTVWILEVLSSEDYVDEDGNSLDLDMPVSASVLEVFRTRKEAHKRVRQLIDLDRAEEEAQEADVEEDEDEDEDEDNDPGVEEEGDDEMYEDEKEWVPEYEAEELYGHYRLTRVEVGKFYGWHDLSKK